MIGRGWLRGSRRSTDGRGLSRSIGRRRSETPPGEAAELVVGDLADGGYWGEILRGERRRRSLKRRRHARGREWRERVGRAPGGEERRALEIERFLRESVFSDNACMTTPNLVPGLLSIDALRSSSAQKGSPNPGPSLSGEGGFKCSPETGSP